MRRVLMTIAIMVLMFGVCYAQDGTPVATAWYVPFIPVAATLLSWLIGLGLKHLTSMPNKYIPVALFLAGAIASAVDYFTTGGANVGIWAPIYAVAATGLHQVIAQLKGGNVPLEIKP